MLRSLVLLFLFAPAVAFAHGDIVHSSLVVQIMVVVFSRWKNQCRPW